MGTKENSRIRTGAAPGRDSGGCAYKLCGQEPGECGKLQEHPDTLIKLQARNCKVVIHGARLKIDYYTAEEMKITGQVGSLEFET